MQEVHFYDSSLLMQLKKHERLKLINSIGGFKPVALVGTKGLNQVENVAIFSSFVHVGSNPPLMGLIFRPSNPERDTLINILETGKFTVNHITENTYKQAHQTAARYESNVSEFEEVGLTPQYNNNFSAPFVAESPIQLGLELKEHLPIKLNDSTLVIGEITQIYLPKNCLGPDGFVNLEKANTLTCSGLDSYHKTIQLERLGFAHPTRTAIKNND